MNIQKLKEINLLRTIALWLRYKREKGSFFRGSNNTIKNKGCKVATRIQIQGFYNNLIIENNTVVYDSLIRINGKNNKVILHSKAYLRGAELYIEGDNCIIEIGSNTYIGHHSHLACTEGCKLKIDSDCMLSSYVQIRTGDSHSIINMEGDRINPAANINIGKHCWIGEGVKLLKGVNLSHNTVVSTGAIVTKSFEQNVLIGGIPAKIIKENINWDEKRL